MNKTSVVLYLICLLGVAQWSVAQDASDPVEGNDAPDQSVFTPGRKARPVSGPRWPDGWMARGNHCNRENVQVLRNGETFSILMDDYSLDLTPGSGNGLDQVVTCVVNLVMEPPPGQMFVGMQQSISGGMIKSEKSRTVLNVNYSIGARGYRAPPQRWERGAIQAADTQSVFSIFLANTRFPNVLRCREKVIYRLRLQLVATRADVRNEFVVAGVDSVDGQFLANVKPVYAPCR